MVNKQLACVKRGKKSINRTVVDRIKRTSTLPTATPVIGSAPLVDQLGRFIEEQSLQPGDRLPSIRELADRFLEEAGVACVEGPAFGAAGEGFIRFSFAVEVARVHEAVERMRAVL